MRSHVSNPLQELKASDGEFNRALCTLRQLRCTNSGHTEQFGTEDYQGHTKTSLEPIAHHTPSTFRVNFRTRGSLVRRVDFRLCIDAVSRHLKGLHWVPELDNFETEGACVYDAA